eukprot:CAMPEP_0169091340 /NCGR_PEP_ID=MMETSP1015-20121227/16309_1 /TAXON_ID=342587 /ORGANISM="Karlodinium micrum, Strain CCMP2283" /LENGTH=400 /DNA_ID=CAMNT_0009151823 /DNA_START=65 /DNA_END=1268 /DNA_ORIENTATION=-
MSAFALLRLPLLHSFRARLLAVAVGLSCSQAQLPPLGGGPSPNSLLNDLRAIQFPSGGAGGQATAPGGGMPSGMGMGLGLGAQGGAMPSMQQVKAFGGLSGLSGSMPSTAQMGGAFGGGSLGGGLGGTLGMPPPSAMPTMSGSAPQGMMPAESPEDLSCTTGAHAVAWTSAKQRFRSVTSAPLALAPREVLVGALEGAIQDLKSANALATGVQSECGFGKLSLQLLSIATVDDPAGLAQVFSAIEQIASPVLTLALDVPWDAIAQSGWPFFGLLAQINLRKIEGGAISTSAIDGLEDPLTQNFYSELRTALGKDGAAIEAVSAAFLRKEAQSPSALAPLTAMSAQAAAQTELPVRAQMLAATQEIMKQVIGDAAELDVALATSWPLWGLLHVAVDSLASS